MFLNMLLLVKMIIRKDRKMAKERKTAERKIVDQLFANNLDKVKKQLENLNQEKKVSPIKFFSSLKMNVKTKDEAFNEFREARSGENSLAKILKWLSKEMYFDFWSDKQKNWEKFWNFFIGLVFEYEYYAFQETESPDTVLPSEIIDHLDMINLFMPAPYSVEDDMTEDEIFQKEIDAKYDALFDKYGVSRDGDEDE